LCIIVIVALDFNFHLSTAILLLKKVHFGLTMSLALRNILGVLFGKCLLQVFTVNLRNVKRADALRHCNNTVCHSPLFVGNIKCTL